MNNKGAVSFGIILSTLIATFTMIAMFIPTFLNSAGENNKSEKINEDFSKDLRALERIHGIYSNNVSHGKSLIFNDLEMTYTEKEIEANYEKKTVRDNEGFYLNNLTDMKIKSNASLINKKDPSFSYDIVLYLNDNPIHKIKVDKYLDVEVDINSKLFYDKSTDKTNYGDFVIKIENKNNVNIQSFNTEYSRLLNRVVELERDKITQNLYIDNREDWNVKAQIKGDSRGGA